MITGEIYLSKYRILRTLKKNDDVSVLLAEHIQLNSYWIIKKLNSATNKQMQEAQVLKGVKHQGIPLIVDVFMENEWLVIIREYVEGNSLHEIVNDSGVLDSERVVDYGLKLCDILIFLHESLDAPLIYRDLKPENIIVDQHQHLTLIDFGIARFYQANKEHDTTYLGTKGFSAPEQYGFSQSDIRTDVFALGATLYYLLTKCDLGKPPYKLLPFSKVRKDVDAKLENIIVMSCHLNKNQRFQKVSDFKEALKQLVVQPQRVSLEGLIEEISSYLISFEGVSRGVGTTYCTMAYGKYLVNKGLKVLLIDMSNNRNLITLEYSLDTVVKGGWIEYEGLSIVSKDTLIKNIGRDSKEKLSLFDCILVDMGTESFNRDKNIRTETLFYSVKIGSLGPWKIEDFEEVLLDTSTKKSQAFLVNLSSKESFKELQESMEQYRFYQIPFMPVEELKKENQVFTQLSKDLEVDQLWQKEETSFSPKSVKTRLAQLIKL